MRRYEDLPPYIQKAIDAQERIKKARELSRTDNQSVGVTSGLKCSFRDVSHNEEINSYMELDARD